MVHQLKRQTCGRNATGFILKCTTCLAYAFLIQLSSCIELVRNTNLILKILQLLGVWIHRLKQSKLLKNWKWST